MKEKFLKAIQLDCLFFLIANLIFNIISVLTTSTTTHLLKIGVSLIILLICTIISFLIVFFKKKKTKEITIFEKIIYNLGIYYTIFSILTNIFAYIFEEDNFWDIYTILIILAFSAIISLSNAFVKINSFLLSSITHFFVCGIFYYIVFVVKASLKGSNILISVAIYLLIFIISSVIYYFVFERKKKEAEKEISYTNMFN